MSMYDCAVCSEKACKHTLETIDRQQKAIEVLMGMGEFYGDLKKWVIDDYVYDNCNSGYAILIAYNWDDEEDLDGIYRGGKIARQAIKKAKEILEREG